MWRFDVLDCVLGSVGLLRVVLFRVRVEIFPNVLASYILCLLSVADLRPERQLGVGLILFGLEQRLSFLLILLPFFQNQLDPFDAPLQLIHVRRFERHWGHLD